MAAQWYHSSNDVLERVSRTVSGLWHFLAQAERAHRLRQILLLILALWAVLSLAELIWTFLPQSAGTIPAQATILNPVESDSGAPAARSVDIDSMVAWQLFGVAAEAVPGVVAASQASTNDREGIEKGARETRLDLKLRGIISASDDGLGHAIIENRSSQEVYAVGDDLPVKGNVSLAKVLPAEVVLDNNGTYELLRLYEETALLGQLPPASASRPAAPPADPTVASGPGSEDTSAIAGNFRRQLYENPQSLAEVVRVTAVRENNALMGYRIEPGKKSKQFTQLGFKAGDLVTSVNGISLDNPGNTMQLYQVMRSASEAVFDLERGGENLTLTVSLDEASGGG